MQSSKSRGVDKLVDHLPFARAEPLEWNGIFTRRNFATRCARSGTTARLASALDEELAALLAVTGA